MSSLDVLLVIFLSILTTVQSALYRFIPEDSDLFVDCADQPEMNGVTDWANLLDYSCDNEEIIHARGTVTILWDIEQTDRVSLDIELKKYARGSWHRTFLSLRVIDLCREMRDTNSIVYDSWSKHIILVEGGGESMFWERCLVKYRYEPFVVKGETDFKGMNMEGRHKLVLIFHACDKYNLPKPNSTCLEIPGELVKV
uniref:Uncharacterized protein n=1 Tax=Glossina palpalis gambiensis TaxID=67801 RepID=A0A1B0BU19_9MUSC